MQSMQQRLADHIEFHEAIDSHKSEAAFLKAVLKHVQNLEQECDRLNAKSSPSYKEHVCGFNRAMDGTCFVCGQIAENW